MYTQRIHTTYNRMYMYTLVMFGKLDGWMAYYILVTIHATLIFFPFISSFPLKPKIGKEMSIHFFLHVFFYLLFLSFSMFPSSPNINLTKRKRIFMQIAARRKQVTANKHNKDYFHKIITNVRVLEVPMESIWHRKNIGSSRR